MTRKALRSVFLDTVPVLTGYLFLGIGFGILLLKKTGHGVLYAAAMGLFIYAGSAQYLAVSLLASHASVLSAAIATFLLNARHIFYGLSMVESYKGAPKKPYLILSLTDETYSLVTQNSPPQGISRHRYCFLVSLFNHTYWVIGCTLGSLAGNLIPVNFQGIEFVLTALFVTMFVEQWLSAKKHLSALIGVGSTLVCLLIFDADIFLIPSMALIAVLLTLTRKTGKRGEEDA